MEPLNNLLESPLNLWKPLDKYSTQNGRKIVEAVTRTPESQYSQYSSVSPHTPPWPPQEINLAKIPNFIIEFIPLTFPAKIEKINQIYKH